MFALNFCFYLELLLLISNAIAEIERKQHFYDAMFPGTKWCGPGDVADHYEDLGSEVQSDACCRDHDHCPDTIQSGQTKHNLTNYAFYTKLHCDCDDAFLKCLQTVDESEEKTSQSVGHFYFNVLDTKCFREEFPVLRCLKYDGYAPHKRALKRPMVVNIDQIHKAVQNAMRASKRCAEYEYDNKAPKEWQWFDVPRFE